MNNNPYVVFDELLSNAIDSYLIRKSDEAKLTGLEVSFLLEFFPRVLDANKLEFRITCTDNGAGFGDGQIKAFVTKDTSYKDDLAIEGIGKCRGSGRIQFLHYFAKVEVDSVFTHDGKPHRRTLSIDDSAIKEINEQSFVTADVTDPKIQTTFILDVIKPNIYKKSFDARDVRDDFSAESLKTYVMVNFLQRLVSLNTSLGKFQIRFKTLYAGQHEEAILTPDNLPKVTATKDVVIYYKDATGIDTANKETFNISHYKLSKSAYKLKRNFVTLCAKSSAVKTIIHKYLKTKALEDNDIAGFYHIILIESDYLDEHVNVQRDGFDIPKNSQQSDLFLRNLISMEQIYEAVDDSVREMLAPPNWDKEEIVRNVSNKYGISSAMISEAKVRIHYGHTEEYVVKRVLSSYQEQIIKDTSEIFDIKVEIENTDPTSPQFREKLNALAWKYTASLKSIDMANLSQIVVRRAAILEILSLATTKNLTAQAEDETKKRCDEKMIHNVFFPMGKDNKEIEDHDIWLLSEEYHYFEYIASDKALSKIRWDESNMLFDSDIDDKMQELLKKNYEGNCAKRPDIAIFSKEGSVIIIEFKAPGVSLDEHTGDLMEYAQLLMAKSKGKLKKVYGYLLGTEVNPNRIISYKQFPNGKGWFDTQEIREHSTGTRLGELYSEILFYEDLVDRAAKRLEVYKTRLGISWTA